VDAEVVFFLEGDDLVEGIDGADGCGAEGCNNGADLLCGEERFEDFEVHAAVVVGGDRYKGKAEDSGDAAVGIVGLIGGSNDLGVAVFSSGELAGDP